MVREGSVPFTRSIKDGLPHKELAVRDFLLGFPCRLSGPRPLTGSWLPNQQKVAGDRSCMPRAGGVPFARSAALASLIQDYSSPRAPVSEPLRGAGGKTRWTRTPVPSWTRSGASCSKIVAWNGQVPADAPGTQTPAKDPGGRQRRSPAQDFESRLKMRLLQKRAWTPNNWSAVLAISGPDLIACCPLSSRAYADRHLGRGSPRQLRPRRSQRTRSNPSHIWAVQLTLSPLLTPDPSFYCMPPVFPNDWHFHALLSSWVHKNVIVIHRRDVRRAVLSAPRTSVLRPQL
mgnify:CR=1 FL=1